MTKVSLPRIGSFAADYRAVVDFPNGDRPADDTILISDGRVGLFLVTSAPLEPVKQGSKALSTDEAELQAIELVVLKG